MHQLNVTRLSAVLARKRRLQFGSFGQQAGEEKGGTNSASTFVITVLYCSVLHCTLSCNTRELPHATVKQLLEFIGEIR
ncbi:hypothetical protein DM02DRAFT_609399 [Periconia macrospinosa]|uniref:Uncharacterized protein n=1 Tax=Periconia macrospinosa TaxID=97972 RepID=A0A2V1E9J8_9PLEO|nr:hypothetical protein DM02DRAFT_609399 [Periconia macrospinosa]